MATKISSVKYEEIPGKANRMRQEGVKLNNEITNAYNSIKNMSSNWYGKRYNALVKSFNGMVSSLNEMLTLVVKEIPDTLDTVAKNYAKADGGSVSSSGSQSPKKISDIAESKATGMKFIESSVSSTKKSVEQNFQKAISSMNSIESVYKSIDWDSDASKKFKQKFNKLKKEITESFTNIKKDFAKLMQATIQDISGAEKANTVN